MDRERKQIWDTIYVLTYFIQLLFGVMAIGGFIVLALRSPQGPNWDRFSLSLVVVGCGGMLLSAWPRWIMDRERHDPRK